jgi:transcriptional regulator with XRE-family HTH domain
MKQTDIEFGILIRQRLRALKLTQEECASKMGVSRESLNRLMGKNPERMQVGTLAALARALHWHPSYILKIALSHPNAELPQRKLVNETQHFYSDWASAFIKDVSFPDHSVVPAGARFEKIWEVQNTGTQPWVDCQLVCVDENLTVNRKAGGSALLEAKLIPDSPSVHIADTGSGATTCISVTFTAPNRPATYASYWKMLLPNGELAFPEREGLSCIVRVESYLEQLDKPPELIVS